VLWIHEIARLAAGVACAALFVAGSRERAGDRTGTRRLARRAGFGAAIATAVQILAAPWVPWSALPAAAGAAAGFVALLAGLAGKPRPSCWFAAALWLAGVSDALARLGGSWR
jgi:hypothetical protein